VLEAEQKFELPATRFASCGRYKDPRVSIVQYDHTLVVLTYYEGVISKRSRNCFGNSDDTLSARDCM
jgi:hypothetical protein